MTLRRLEPGPSQRKGRSATPTASVVSSVPVMAAMVLTASTRTWCTTAGSHSDWATACARCSNLQVPPNSRKSRTDAISCNVLVNPRLQQVLNLHVEVAHVWWSLSRPFHASSGFSPCENVRIVGCWSAGFTTQCLNTILRHPGNLGCIGVPCPNGDGS